MNSASETGSVAGARKSKATAGVAAPTSVVEEESTTKGIENLRISLWLSPVTPDSSLVVIFVLSLVSCRVCFCVFVHPNTHTGHRKSHRSRRPTAAAAAAAAEESQSKADMLHWGVPIPVAPKQVTLNTAPHLQHPTHSSRLNVDTVMTRTHLA